MSVRSVWRLGAIIALMMAVALAVPAAIVLAFQSRGMVVGLKPAGNLLEIAAWDMLC